MKQAITIRLERPNLVALKRHAQQRKVSVSAAAEEAIAALLDGHDRALPLRSVIDELREQMKEQAETHRTSMQEQRDLFDKAQEANARQANKVLDLVSKSMQATLQPLVDAMGGSPKREPSSTTDTTQTPPEFGVKLRHASASSPPSR